MKTLVYLEKAAVRGGIEIFAERHAARLRAAGRDVTVSSSAEGADSFDEIIVHKCTDAAVLESLPAEKTVFYVHDHEPICPRGCAYTPLKHNCLRPGGLWPCLLCAPARRDWKGALARVFAQKRMKRAIARFRKIAVISNFMKSRLAANGFDPRKISVERPLVEVRPPEGTAPDDVDILYAGQLVRGKGVHLLLRALALIPPDRTLDVVGSGNMEASLKSLARQLGLDGRVRWRGFRDNPHDWMRAARCVAVPSFWQEPFGLVAAEAVALGRRVVAFATGGIPEACGGKAVLVPPGDVAAFAKALDC